jgi:hypothetical protein
MWAREQEFEADKGLPPVHKTLRGITVADVVNRYRDEVVPRKRGADPRRSSSMYSCATRWPKWPSVMSPPAW